MAVPTYRGIAEKSAGSGASKITPTLPTGVESGDFLICEIDVRDETPRTIETPAGWTAHGSEEVDSSISKRRVYLFTRVYEGTNPEFVASGEATHLYATVLAISKGTYNSTTPINVISSWAVEASESPKLPAVKTTVPECLAVSCLEARSALTEAPAEGWTERQNTAYVGSVSTRECAAAETTPTGNAKKGSATASAAITIAIAPAPGVAKVVGASTIIKTPDTGKLAGAVRAGAAVKLTYSQTAAMTVKAGSSASTLLHLPSTAPLKAKAAVAVQTKLSFLQAAQLTAGIVIEAAVSLGLPSTARLAGAAQTGASSFITFSQSAWLLATHVVSATSSLVSSAATKLTARAEALAETTIRFSAIVLSGATKVVGAAVTFTFNAVTPLKGVARARAEFNSRLTAESELQGAAGVEASSLLKLSQTATTRAKAAEIGGESNLALLTSAVAIAAIRVGGHAVLQFTEEAALQARATTKATVNLAFSNYVALRGKAVISALTTFILSAIARGHTEEHVPTLYVTVTGPQQANVTVDVIHS